MAGFSASRQACAQVVDVTAGQLGNASLGQLVAVVAPLLVVH
ncbi:hypothetical protein ACFQ7B_14535 [Streptomyces erythrochromogenes]